MHECRYKIVTDAGEVFNERFYVHTNITSEIINVAKGLCFEHSWCADDITLFVWDWTGELICKREY